MDCNRDDALRARDVALSKFECQDYEGAKKFLLKAERLNPELDGIKQLLAVANVLVRAQVKIGLEVDWYGVLEVDSTADEAAIKKQYRKLALVLHPDKNKSVGAEAAFKVVSEAFGVLSDKTKRDKFDLMRSIRLHQAAQRSFVPATSVYTTNAGAPYSTTAAAYAARATAAAYSRVPGAFWTKCHECSMQFQYDKKYLDMLLRCTRCGGIFKAVELTATNCVRTYNFSNFVKPETSHRSTAQPAPVKTADFVEEAFLRAKNSRKEREREEKTSMRNKEKEIKRTENDKKKQKIRTMDDYLTKGSQGPKVQEPESTVKAEKSAEKVKEEQAERQEVKKEPENNNDLGNDTQQANGQCKEEPKQEVPNTECEQPKNNEERKNKSEQPEAEEVSAASRNNLKRQRVVVEDDEDETEQQVDNSQKSGKQQSGAPPVQAPRRSSRRKRILSYNFDEDDDLVNFPAKKKVAPSSSKSLDSECGSKVEEGVVSQTASDYPHDFDEDRSLVKLKKGQVWAIYGGDGEDDSMPRWYGRIERIHDEEHIRLKWLEPEDISEDAAMWLKSGHYVTCGRFKLMKECDTVSLKTMCHEVTVTPAGRSVLLISPRAGEVWALYHNWQWEWLTDSGKKQFNYVAVEVIGDYTAEKGVKVAPLKKIQGLNRVFEREAPGRWQHFDTKDLIRFSHRIPAVQLEAGSRIKPADNSAAVVVPPGSWELDSEAVSEHLAQ